MTDLSLMGATTALSTTAVLTDNNTTAIVSLVAQIIGLVTFIVKTRKERRSRRKLQKPNYSQD